MTETTRSRTKRTPGAKAMTGRSLAGLMVGAGIFVYVFFMGTARVEALTIIDSLPFVCDTQGETYEFAQDLVSSSGTAVTIAASDVIIDGKGHELGFGQSGPGVGVDVNGQSGAVIQNIVFRTPYAGAELARHILVDGESPMVSGSTFHIVGPGANVGLSGTVIVGATIEGCQFHISGTGPMDAFDIEGAPVLVEHNTFFARDIDESVSGYKTIFRFMSNGSVFARNTVVVEPSVVRFYPIGAWDSDGLMILANTIQYGAEHGRIIAPDNNSEGWLIQDNTVIVTADVQTNNVVYGIRYRGTEAPANCGGDHIIEYNTVDCSQVSGTCFPISIGDDAGGDNCANVDIRYNLFLSNESAAFSFYSGNVVDQDIYCNRMESMGGSAVPVNISGEPSDIRFSHNEILTAQAGGFEVSTQSNHGTEVVFCGTVPADPDVTGGGDVTVSPEPCQDGESGCHAGAGARVSADGGVLDGGVADGGGAAEAGVLDAGVVDAGSVTGDGGGTQDGGDSGSSESGCGCRTNGGAGGAASGGLMLLWFLFLWVRRWGRRL